MDLKTTLLIGNTIITIIMFIFLFFRLKEIKEIIGKTYHSEELKIWMKDVYITLIIITLIYYLLLNWFIIKYF